VTQELGELNVVEVPVVPRQLGPVGEAVPEQVVSQHPETGVGEGADRPVPRGQRCGVAVDQDDDTPLQPLALPPNAAGASRCLPGCSAPW
jgi:hypothetical protein